MSLLQSALSVLARNTNLDLSAPLPTPMDEINAVTANLFSASAASDPLGAAIAENNQLLGQLEAGFPAIPQAQTNVQAIQNNQELAASLLLASLSASAKSVPSASVSPIVEPVANPDPVESEPDEQTTLLAQALVNALFEKLVELLSQQSRSQVHLPVFNEAKWNDKDFQKSLKEYFDADFYEATYPEVAASGLSAWEHYTTIGYKKGYVPMHWDESGFLASLDTAAEAVEAGDYTSGLEWFLDKIHENAVKKKLIAALTSMVEHRTQNPPTDPAPVPVQPLGSVVSIANPVRIAPTPSSEVEDDHASQAPHDEADADHRVSDRDNDPANDSTDDRTDDDSNQTPSQVSNQGPDHPSRPEGWNYNRNQGPGNGKGNANAYGLFIGRGNVGDNKPARFKAPRFGTDPNGPTSKPTNKKSSSSHENS
ncbi:MAG: hypothetical protein R2857_14175 [Vampirovibrionales bacterium]